MKSAAKAVYAPHAAPAACSVERIQVPSLKQIMDESQALLRGLSYTVGGLKKRQLMAHHTNALSSACIL